MENNLGLEVKLMSTEIVKPSSPTPSHLKTFHLSALDQTYTPLLHLPIMLSYSNSTNTTIDILSLKDSLSETLTRFYPLAGRCNDASSINCNDQGVPFIVTRVLNCPHILDFINSPHKLELLPRFYPPFELKIQLNGRPISEQVHLAFQVNLFDCGGIVLGCYFFHKLLDAVSLGTFLKHWAAVVTKRNENIINSQPNFDITVKTFPPLPVGQLCSSEQPSKVNKVAPTAIIPLVYRTFAFSRAAIMDLKAKAATTAHQNPTSFEVVAAFRWEQASSAAGELVGSTIGLSMTASIRAKPNLQLPKESIGNLVINVQARAEKDQANLGQLTTQIHAVLTNKVEEKLKLLKEEKNPGAFMVATRNEHFSDVEAGKAGFYTLTSLCRIGFDEADFGVGKPKLILLTDAIPRPFVRNTMTFTDYIDSNGDYGIRVLLCLPKEEMHILESNPHFLAFTCTILVE